MGSKHDKADKLAVRIAVNKGETLIGSGVLFVREKNSSILILTAAHVVGNIWGKSNKEADIYISCRDDLGHQKIIEAKVSESCKEDNIIEANKVYVHKNYDSDNYYYDVAIIVLSWEEWMKDIESFQMGEFKNIEEATGCGFPSSKDNEYNKDSALAGKKFINGDLTHYDKKKGICYSYRQDGVYHYKISREDVVKGYSGAGLFAERECGEVFMGIVSQGAGNKDTAGNELWAASSSMFLELFEMYNVRLEAPESFQPYIEMAKQEIAWNKPANRFFTDCCNTLIQSINLTPLVMQKNTKEFDRFLCEGNRSYCDFFIAGQLKKAVVFHILNIPLVSEDHYLVMPEPYEKEKVNVEYLCTEEKFYDFIGTLVEKGYFKSEKYLNKPTIFICNGKGGNGKDYFSRKNCQTIIPNIADQIISTHEIRDKFGLEEVELVEFNIIRGKISSCNLCFAGIDYMIKQIDSDSNDKVKTNMEGELIKLWEI